MALAAFDTLEFVDELEKAGVPEKQARAISLAVRKSHESSDVATKADLEKLGTELHHEIHEVEMGLRSDMEKLGSELRYEISDLRKDNELLRKDIDVKHESLRKDMGLMSARFEKRLLLLGVALGALTLFGQDTLSALLRLFH